MSVFVSFRGSDRIIKNEVVFALRESFKNDDNFKDEEVWESDEGCVSDFSSDCINAINRSSIFVVIISDKAMEPSYVINEVIAARQCEMRGTLNIIVYKITESNYTPQFDFQLNHISYTNPNLVTNQEVLVNRVKILLNKRKFGEPEKPYDVFVPEISGVSLYNQGFFVENSRNNILDKISEKINEKNILFLTFMDGYGKKSTVNKWLELNQHLYKNIITVFDFEGGIEEFFIHGLKFTNINENRFNNLSNLEIIKEKIKIVNQVDKDTIIVVPQLTISKDIDPKILSLISTISCKMIFITPNINKRIKDAFNVIEIKNMDNIYLRELFYHYYDEVTAEEEEMLNHHLDKFFDSIDGHTKSIEITAITLADEFGIYPEDLPEILEKIYKTSDNELSNRITGLISNLFDLSNFNNLEKQLLTISSFIATTPIDEKNFIDIIKELNCYDSKSINSLVDKKWLEVNRSTRTVCIEKLLASACLSKVEDNEFINQILKVISKRLVQELSLSNRNMYKLLTNAVMNIFKYLNCENAFEFMKLLLTFDKDITEKENISKCYNDALKELDEIINDDVEDEIKFMLEMSNLILTFNNEIFDLKNKISYEDKLMEIFGLIDADALYEELEDCKLFIYVKPFFDSLLSYNMNEIVCSYIKTCNILLSDIVYKDLLGTISDKTKVINKIFEDRDNNDLFKLFLNFGYNIHILSNNSMLKDTVCKLIYELLKKYNYTELKSLTFNITSSYLNSLLNSTNLVKDYAYYTSMEKLFNEIMLLINSNHKMFFVDIEEENNYRIELLSSMLNVYIDYSEPEKAKKIYEQISTITDIDEETFIKRFEYFGKYINFINVSGTFVDNLDLLKKEISFLHSIIIDCYDDEDSEDEKNALINFLNDVNKMIINIESNKDSFINYQDYYQAYSYKEKEKTLLNKYINIANQAKDISYKDLSRKELLDIGQLLKSKALSKTAWEVLAPSAFALVSEVGFRLLGYYHHLEQYISACAMCDGKISEVLNGEGKTYTIVLVAFLKSLYNKQVHIIDNSQYLSNRNYEWMYRIFGYLGLKVGLIPERYYMDELPKLSKCDIVYGTISRHMFLKMNVDGSNSLFDDRLSYDCAIFDEADDSMITCGMLDYSLTSNSSNNEKPVYEFVYKFIKELPNDGTYFNISPTKDIILKDEYFDLINTKLDNDIYMSDNYMLNLIKNASIICIRCLYVYKINHDYFVVNNDLKMEDKNTGYFVDLSSKYKYFLAKKENMNSLADSIAITYNKLVNLYSASEFINNYKDFSGTTATAISMSVEFKELYDKEIIHIPPKKEVIRIDHTPYLFYNNEDKFRFVIDKIIEKYNKKQPVIVICGSVNDSVIISRELIKLKLPHHLLNANNSDKENEILKEAGMLGQVTITTALSNRGVDILLGGDPNASTNKELIVKGYKQEEIYKVMYDKTSIDNKKLIEDFNIIFEKNKNLSLNQKGEVEKLGGLCVIGTECFEDLRNEQQVRGRAGRQGSPGESYICYSLDDQSIYNILGFQVENFRNTLYFDRSNKFNYIQDDTISKSIYLMRKTNQNKKLNNHKQSNTIKYYKHYRQLFIKLFEGIRNKKISIGSLINDYILESEEIINIIEDYPNVIKNTMGIENLYPYLDVNLIDAKKYTKALQSGFMLKLGNILGNDITTNILISEVLAGIIKAWQDFINISQSEINNINNVIINKEKKENILNDFIPHNYNKLIAEAIAKTLINFKLDINDKNIRKCDPNFIRFNKVLNDILDEHKSIRNYNEYLVSTISDTLTKYIDRFNENKLNDYNIFNSLVKEIFNKSLDLDTESFKRLSKEELQELLYSKFFDTYHQKDEMYKDKIDYETLFGNLFTKNISFIIEFLAAQASQLLKLVNTGELSYESYNNKLNKLFDENLDTFDLSILRMFFLLKLKPSIV